MENNWERMLLSMAYKCTIIIMYCMCNENITRSMCLCEHLIFNELLHDSPRTYFYYYIFIAIISYICDLPNFYSDDVIKCNASLYTELQLRHFSENLGIFRWYVQIWHVYVCLSGGDFFPVRELALPPHLHDTQKQLRVIHCKLGIITV